MDEFHEDTRLALVRVRIPADARVIDGHSYELICYDRIPPENIQVLSRNVTGEMPDFFKESLTEIMKNPTDMPDPLERYANVLTGGTQHNFHGKTVVEKVNDSATWLGLYDNERLLAIVAFVEERPYIALDLALTDPAERDKGYIRQLLTYWIKHHGPFISSGNQTTAAQMMWKHFKEFPGTFKLSLYDLSSGQKAAWQNPDEPWNDSEDLRILAEDSQVRLRRAVHEALDIDVYIWWGAPASPGCHNP